MTRAVQATVETTSVDSAATSPKAPRQRGTRGTGSAAISAMLDIGRARFVQAPPAWRASPTTIDETPPKGKCRPLSDSIASDYHQAKDSAAVPTMSGVD